jgi:hypothetical protein
LKIFYLRENPFGHASFSLCGNPNGFRWALIRTLAWIKHFLCHTADGITANQAIRGRQTGSWPGTLKSDCAVFVRGGSSLMRAASFEESPRQRFRAFSSEVDTGSREENAINKDLETFSDAMGSENALVEKT